MQYCQCNDLDSDQIKSTRVTLFQLPSFHFEKKKKEKIFPERDWSTLYTDEIISCTNSLAKSALQQPESRKPRNSFLNCFTNARWWLTDEKPERFDTWESVYISWYIYLARASHRLGRPSNDTFIRDPPTLAKFFEITMTSRPEQLFRYLSGYSVMGSPRLEKEESNDKAKLHVCIWIVYGFPGSFQQSPTISQCTRDTDLFVRERGENTRGEFDGPNGGSLSDDVETRAKILSKPIAKDVSRRLETLSGMVLFSSLGNCAR